MNKSVALSALLLSTLVCSSLYAQQAAKTFEVRNKSVTFKTQKGESMKGTFTANRSMTYKTMTGTKCEQDGKVTKETHEKELGECTNASGEKAACTCQIQVGFKCKGGVQTLQSSVNTSSCELISNLTAQGDEGAMVR